jgi:heterodisulfide reductase subunit C
MKFISVDNKEEELSCKVIKNIKASKDLGLLKCVQCGMCTAVCPAAKFTDYNPRYMVEKVLENDKSVIEYKEMWNCFYCYTCHSICSVGNSPCEVNQILRQIAIDEGKEDKYMKPLASYGETFLEIGIGGIPKSYFMELHEDIEGWLDLKENLELIREKLDLGPIKMHKESIDEVRKLLKDIDFDKRVEKLKKSHDKAQ